MKRSIILVILLFALISTLFACTEVPDESQAPSEHGTLESSQPSEQSTLESSQPSEESSEEDILTDKILEVLSATTIYFEAEFELYGSIINMTIAQDGDKMYSYTLIDGDEPFEEYYIKNDDGAFQLFSQDKTYTTTEYFESDDAFEMKVEDILDVSYDKLDGEDVTKVRVKVDDSTNMECYFKDDELVLMKQLIKTYDMNIEVTMRISNCLLSIPDQTIFDIPSDYSVLTAKYPSHVPEFTGGSLVYVEEEGPDFYYSYSVLEFDSITNYAVALAENGFVYYIYKEESYYECFDANSNYIALTYYPSGSGWSLDIIYGAYKPNSVAMPAGVPICSAGKSHMGAPYDGDFATYYVLFITEEQVNTYVGQLTNAGFTNIIDNQPGYYSASNSNGDVIELIIELYDDGTICLFVTYYTADYYNTF